MLVQGTNIIQTAKRGEAAMANRESINMFLLYLLIQFVVSFRKTDSDDVIKHLIPDNYSASKLLGEAPIQLKWMLKPHLTSDLSIKKMEFAMDLTIACSWKDDGLNVTTAGYVNIPSSVSTSLWYPWMSFENCKGCRAEIIDPQHDLFSLEYRLVQVVFRKEIRFICALDVSYYPFDKQKCQIEVRMMIPSTYAPINRTTEEEDEYYAKIDEHPLLVPPEYNLFSVARQLTVCKNQVKTRNDVCFKYVFIFQRISLPHILLIFLPSMLIVILSWISFWLDVNLAAPRIALGLTSLLTLSTQFSSAQQNLPAVATIKALDIWMFMCIFMVFSSLLVYAFSYTCSRNKIPHANTPVIRKLNSAVKRPVASYHSGKQLTRRIKVIQLKLMSLNIDKGARIVFPLFFLIFHIYYWNTYTSPPNMDT